MGVMQGPNLFDRLIQKVPYYRVEEGYERNFIQRSLIFVSVLLYVVALNSLLGWLLGWFLSLSRSCVDTQNAAGWTPDWIIWRVGALIPNVQTYLQILDEVSHETPLPRVVIEYMHLNAIPDLSSRCFLLGFSHGYFLISAIVAFLSGIFYIRCSYHKDIRNRKIGKLVMPVRPYPRIWLFILISAIGTLFLPYFALFLVIGEPLGSTSTHVYRDYMVVQDEYFSLKNYATSIGMTVILSLMMTIMIINKKTTLGGNDGKLDHSRSD